MLVFLYHHMQERCPHRLFRTSYLQNSTYPAARHMQNSITLKIEVEGISRIKNIPIAAQSKAKPIIRFIIKILTAVVTLTLSYAAHAAVITYKKAEWPQWDAPGYTL